MNIYKWIQSRPVFQCIRWKEYNSHKSFRNRLVYICCLLEEDKTIQASFVNWFKWFTEKDPSQKNHSFINQTINVVSICSEVYLKGSIQFRPVMWTGSNDSQKRSISKEWIIHKWNTIEMSFYLHWSRLEGVYLIQTRFVNWFKWFSEKIQLKRTIHS